MPALCFLVVRAYYAKRICRILCVSLHVSTVVDQWADFRTVGVYAMLLSFSECSTELLGDRVWLEQASHQKTTEPHFVHTLYMCRFCWGNWTHYSVTPTSACQLISLVWKISAINHALWWGSDESTHTSSLAKLCALLSIPGKHCGDAF